MAALSLSFARASRSLAALTLALVLGGCGESGDPLDAMMTRVMAAHGMTGASVAIGQPGEAPELRAYGFADLAGERPVTTDDAFKIASLSKPVTSAAVMALVRDGRLDLDDRLADIVPAAGNAADPRMGRITLRTLLRHSGGWDRDETFEPFFLTEAELAERVGGPVDAALDCADVADAMLDLELQFEPGARYAYSNLGFCWLGRAISAVTGQPYAAAAHALVPEAAGLSLEPGADTVEYRIDPADRDDLILRPAVSGPAGGWIATAEAYWRFAAAPLDPRVMERPDYAAGVDYYGLGWRVWQLSDGRTVLSHFGAMHGVFAIVLKSPDGGPVFVALFNARPADDLALFADLFDGVTGLPGWGD